MNVMMWIAPLFWVVTVSAGGKEVKSLRTRLRKPNTYGVNNIYNLQTDNSNKHTSGNNNKNNKLTSGESKKEKKHRFGKNDKQGKRREVLYRRRGNPGLESIIMYRWSRWSAWRKCSTECDQGVSKRKRRCKKHQKNVIKSRLIQWRYSNCKGNKKQYKLCYKRPCNDNDTVQQVKPCKKLNNITVFGEKIINWISVMPSIDRKCDIICRARGQPKSETNQYKVNQHNKQYKVGQHKSEANQYKVSQHKSKPNQYKMDQYNNETNQYKVGPYNSEINQYKVGQYNNVTNQYKVGQHNSETNRYKVNQYNSETNQYKVGQHNSEAYQYKVEQNNYETIQYKVGILVDGTDCGDGGVCIKGRCRSLGCDGVVGSGKVRDKCEKCGGDEGSCVRVEDSVSLQQQDRSARSQNHHYGQGLTGYHPLLTIPAGSTNILLEEISQSKLLALRDRHQHFILNGVFKDRTQVAMALGTSFVYTATTDNGDEYEMISARGPTQDDVEVVLLQLEHLPHLIHSGNMSQDLHYQYYHPKHKTGTGKKRNKKKTTCPSKCSRSRHGRRHFCKSDFVIRCRIEDYSLVKGEVRLDVTILYSYSNIVHLSRREFVWVTCRCSGWKIGRELLMMVNLDKNGTRIVADTDSYVRRFTENTKSKITRWISKARNGCGARYSGGM